MVMSGGEWRSLRYKREGLFCMVWMGRRGLGLGVGVVRAMRGFCGVEGGWKALLDGDGYGDGGLWWVTDRWFL